MSKRTLLFAAVVAATVTVPGHAATRQTADTASVRIAAVTAVREARTCVGAVGCLDPIPTLPTPPDGVPATPPVTLPGPSCAAAAAAETDAVGSCEVRVRVKVTGVVRSTSTNRVAVTLASSTKRPYQEPLAARVPVDPREPIADGAPSPCGALDETPQDAVRCGAPDGRGTWTQRVTLPNGSYSRTIVFVFPSSGIERTCETVMVTAVATAGSRTASHRLPAVQVCA